MDLEQPRIHSLTTAPRGSRDAVPSPEEMVRLLNHVAVDQPLFHLFLVLAATSGARRGQLLALRWKDVDFEHGSLAFQRALVEGPNGPVLAPTKTRRCHRAALDSYSQKLLTEQADRKWKGEFNPDAFIFTRHPRGLEPWKPNWVTQTFIRARSASELSGKRRRAKGGLRPRRRLVR